MIDLYHFDFIYLQNRILKDDLSIFLKQYKNKFNLIITASKKEYKSILENNNNYNKDKIALTGFARYDNYNIIKENMKSENLILIIPTLINDMFYEFNFL